jgi:HSP90 family molecular chaperone
MEQFDVHLYSRKVLIKKNCRELLPNYLRFIKGVVDCEDIPLNISRENYQDTQLLAKLRSTITKRIIREIETESARDPATYLEWHQEF